METQKVINMQQVIEQCVAVTRKVELSNFVCDTACTHFNVLPEDLNSIVEHDKAVEALGTVWVLEKCGKFVGWYDEFGMVLAVA